MLPDAVLHAVSSRSRAGAEEFAARRGFRRAYADDDGLPGYLRLIQDPDVDIVYVATPHASLFTVAKAALEAGKQVLCEKPVTLNARDAAALAGLARRKGLFLMPRPLLRSPIPRGRGAPLRSTRTDGEPHHAAGRHIAGHVVAR